MYPVLAEKRSDEPISPKQSEAAVSRPASAPARAPAGSDAPVDSAWPRRELVAEAVGTFVLVFAGTGAVVVNAVSGGALTHLGISFVFGAVVAALIYTLGHISGAHINPAVTLALWALGRFPARRVLSYILVQLAGAAAASVAVLVCFGNQAKLGATLPLAGNWVQAFAVELLLTFILMLVICGSALDPRAPRGFAGLAIGLTVGLEAGFGGPISGASMNPARSFGPALVAGAWEAHWVYWLAPIVGALVAGWVWQQMRDPLEETSTRLDGG
ncbi:MIP/aquaporin family protein [Gloeobacter morelensis]|uniref:MIP/aquaporin family protein n=1 Tax=Gloeobacter morelensis TaxID=2907343 RepID=UPI001E600D7F|nr:MIP/aquaporin family protein [Gloeobacter morelensis]